MQLTNFVVQSILLTVALANDVKFYTARNCNRSEFSGCYGIGQNVCCVTRNGNVYAVSVSKGPTDVAVMWSGGGCRTQQCSAGGSGVFCCYSTTSTTLTGGSFYTISKKRDDMAQKCTSTMQANVIGYSLGSTSWELHADKVEGAFADLEDEFQTVPEADKISWLKSKGAVSVATTAAITESKEASAQ